MKMKRVFLNLASSLTLGFLAVSCGESTPPQDPPLPVRVMTVGQSGAAAASRYSATVRADVQVDVAFRVGGYVEDILQVNDADGKPRVVQEGDFVRQGAILARIRDTEHKDRLAEAESSLRQATADYERASDLYETNSISRAELDAASSRLAAAKAHHSQAQQTLEDCTLEAPRDGYIIRRNIEVGALAGIGIPAFVIADTRAVKVVYGAPDVAVASIKMGDTQNITVAAIPGRVFHGEVSRIAPSADPNSRTFEVECTVPNPDNLLKVGMIATVQAAGETPQGASILIPLTAVVRPPERDSGYAVFVIEVVDGAERAFVREVDLGAVVGDDISVASGLTDGERIIISGATLARDSQAVTIIP